MSRLTFSPAAIADIEAIWDYTAAHWGVDQADGYTDDIRDVCFSLASGTKVGRRVDVRDGYLRYPVGRHVVYLRQSDRAIVVIRVLHQRMDVSRHLGAGGRIGHR